MTVLARSDRHRFFMLFVFQTCLLMSKEAVSSDVRNLIKTLFLAAVCKSCFHFDRYKLEKTLTKFTYITIKLSFWTNKYSSETKETSRNNSRKFMKRL